MSFGVFQFIASEKKNMSSALELDWAAINKICANIFMERPQILLGIDEA